MRDRNVPSTNNHLLPNLHSMHLLLILKFDHQGHNLLSALARIGNDAVDEGVRENCEVLAVFCGKVEGLLESSENSECSGVNTRRVSALTSFNECDRTGEKGEVY